jgi:hypothetical protein
LRQAFIKRFVRICYRLVHTNVKAKVITVERDVEEWCVSCTVVAHEMFSWVASAVGQIDAFLGYAGVHAFRKVWLGYFCVRNVAEVLEGANVVYKEHYELVRRLVPPERLLNYELGSGWKPFCGFLGREEPEAELPCLNEAAALRQQMAIVLASRFRKAVRKLI